jgi:uncharacterized protein YecE (DUF72 family)
VTILGEKLGPILFQLPPSLEYSEKTVRQFFILLRKLHQGGGVIEPRHQSWLNAATDELCNEFSIARVAADPACAPWGERPGGSSSLVYFRLHGSPRKYYSSYDETFLAGKAEDISALAGDRQVWCIFDNTASGEAIPNSLRLIEKLKEYEPRDST